jgi:tetratricopeptide (TPR) repeat protein
MTPAELLASVQQHLTSDALEAAARTCDELNRRAPTSAEGWYLRAAIHARRGELAGIINGCERTLRLQPNHAGAHYNLGLALQKLERLEEAARAYQAALRINPRLVPAASNLVVVLRELKQLGAALECARHALGVEPGNPFLHNNLGLVLKDQKLFDEARAAFEHALALKPDYALAWYNLGLVYFALNEPEIAEAHYHKALGYTPDDAEIHCDLGAAQQAQNRIPEALASYEQAIALDPEQALAHWNHALALLRAGDYAQGFRGYEWRWRRKESPPPLAGQSLWNGQPLSGGTLFLHAEQGVGDTLQCLRYLPLVKTRDLDLVLEIQPELQRLLAGIPHVNRLTVRGDPVPSFQAQAPLLSLPFILGSTLGNLPSEVPYLKVPDGVGLLALQRIAERRGAFNIGIVWAGNPQHTNDHNRSCRLEDFARLLDLPGVRLFSLQKGSRASDIAAAGLGELIVDLGEVISDFADTAAALMSLDLVISVDTSVVHLAGALARPCWVLLPFASDWRWLCDREDTPWYPTLRLFRQQQRGNWMDVFDRARAQLAGRETRG